MLVGNTIKQIEEAATALAVRDDINVLEVISLFENSLYKYVG